MDRRTFINAAGASGLGLGTGLGGAASAAPSGTLLGLLEDSSRESLPRQLAQRIRTGLRYQDLLAALVAAAVRNVQPYPDVGYKFHSIMVLRSIDASTQHLGSGDKWLPIIWAADYFKEAQEDERANGGWRMRARAGSGATANARTARQRLISALDSWDRDAADAAIVDYAMLAPPDEIFAALFTYGARDLRAIGHKAITVANAHALHGLLDRTQASALLRSTVAALQNSDAGPNPATHDLAPDRSYRQNLHLLNQIPPAWRRGRDDPALRNELRAVLYQGSPQQAGSTLLELLRRGISPDALWQVLFDTAAELIVARPSIVSLHAQTCANALHYAYRVCHDEPTQQLMLLQCASFVAMFRAATGVREQDFQLQALQAPPLEQPGNEAVEKIFSEVAAGHRSQAMRRCLGYLQSGGDATALISAIRHHVVYHADEPHDYKYPEAVLDSYTHSAGEAWQRRFLSAGMALFKAPAAQPSPIVAEARELLAS